MIVTRTPLRVSFLGGGTDYPEWYFRNGGAVLSATIDRYVYVSLRPLRPFFAKKSRVVWNRIEHVEDNSQISHRNVRAVLQYFEIEDALEIFYSSDLPANSGLGSSSALTVGLALAARTHLCANATRWALARDAIHVERDMLGETVGVQDQIAAAHGGLAHITIQPNGIFQRHAQRDPDDFQRHLMLAYVGGERVASEQAEKQVAAIASGKKDSVLAVMQDSVSAGVDLLQAADFQGFGKLVHETWLLKRSLAPGVATPMVDGAYETALRCGAWGGKLLGAGGGGFVLLVAPPESHESIAAELAPLRTIPVEFEYDGATVLLG